MPQPVTQARCTLKPVGDPVHEPNPNQPPPSRSLMVLGISLVVMALLGMLEQTIEQLRVAPPDESFESAASLMVTFVVFIMGTIWLFTRNRQS
jgi:tellurite resistance protein TehA-like permease